MQSMFKLKETIDMVTYWFIIISRLGDAYCAKSNGVFMTQEDILPNQISAELKELEHIHLTQLFGLSSDVRHILIIKKFQTSQFDHLQTIQNTLTLIGVQNT